MRQVMPWAGTGYRKMKDVDIDTALQLFADDAKLYCNIRIGKDSLSLQQSLDRLVSWAKNVAAIYFNQ
jgi:hypothetical protein